MCSGHVSQAATIGMKSLMMYLIWYIDDIFSEVFQRTFKLLVEFNTFLYFHLSTFRKTIEIPILEEDSYEKNVVMYVVIGEPKQLAGKF